MKKIEIFIWNGENIKKNELMGNENSSDMYLTELFFSGTSVDGYYVQQHIDSETKTRNIIIVVGGNTYCSPYSEDKERLIKSCLI